MVSLLIKGICLWGEFRKTARDKFFIDCLKSQENNKEVFFLVVGDGTEYEKIENTLQIDSQKM